MKTMLSMPRTSSIAVRVTSARRFSALRRGLSSAARRSERSRTRERPDSGRRPRLLLHVAVDGPESAGRHPELDDEAVRHRHDPRDDLGALGREVAIEAGLLRMGHDLVERLRLIVV